MSNIWESGRESRLLDEMIAGRKTIEGRLCRGKFAQYAPGDIVNLRRDFRDGIWPRLQVDCQRRMD